MLNGNAGAISNPEIVRCIFGKQPNVESGILTLYALNAPVPVTPNVCKYVS